MKKILILLIFLCNINLVSAQVVTLNKKYYQIEFDTVKHVPLLTHYFLYKKNVVNLYERSSFLRDYSLRLNQQGSSSDYEGSGYDKGHLAPNDDFRFDSIAQRESMYYTNTAPQNSKLNRGLWKSIENFVKIKAILHDTVEVYTGAIYSGKVLGKIQIPTYFFKIVKYDNKEVSFLVQNREYDISVNLYHVMVPKNEILEFFIDKRYQKLLN